MSAQSPPVAVTLLDAAITYADTSLEHARSAPLTLPTPCREWDLGRLLTHVEDSLTAVGEAAELGYVDPTGESSPPPGDPLVDRILQRARATREAWLARITSAPIGVGDLRLDRDDLVRVGALEIAVHGWDVASAVGLRHVVPEELAVPLLEVAQAAIGRDERGRRFAPPRFVGPRATPSARLLGYVGRG